MDLIVHVVGLGWSCVEVFGNCLVRNLTVGVKGSKGSWEAGRLTHIRVS